MHQITDNLWTFRYPLPMLGIDQQRNVTVIRLTSGDLIIHSTAPFSADDVAAIHTLGKPRYLVDGVLLHDTYAKQGQAAFPEATYLAPAGFAEAAEVASQPLLPSPPEWGDEVEVMELQGIPFYDEHVFFHRPSRTLIVCDLLFYFQESTTLWEKFLRRGVLGIKAEPSVNRVFKAMVKDEEAFHASLERMKEWDFERIIVGHGDPVDRNGQRKLEEALTAKGIHP